jgi:hypothetical protein
LAVDSVLAVLVSIFSEQELVSHDAKPHPRRMKKGHIVSLLRMSGDFSEQKLECFGSAALYYFARQVNLPANIMLNARCPLLRKRWRFNVQEPLINPAILARPSPGPIRAMLPAMASTDQIPTAG